MRCWFVAGHPVTGHLKHDRWVIIFKTRLTFDECSHTDWCMYNRKRIPRQKVQCRSLFFSNRSGTCLCQDSKSHFLWAAETSLITFHYLFFLPIYVEEVEHFHSFLFSSASQGQCCTCNPKTAQKTDRKQKVWRQFPVIPKQISRYDWKI